MEWSGDLEKDSQPGDKYYPFKNPPVISFTADKSVALAIANDMAGDWGGEETFIYVISMNVKPEQIYFHYKYSSLGYEEYPREKEVTVYPAGNPYKIIKKIDVE